MQETGYQKAVEHIHANRERLTETVMQRSGIYLNKHYTRYQVDNAGKIPSTICSIWQNR